MKDPLYQMTKRMMIQIMILPDQMRRFKGASTAQFVELGKNALMSLLVDRVSANTVLIRTNVALLCKMMFNLLKLTAVKVVMKKKLHHNKYA